MKPCDPPCVKFTYFIVPQTRTKFGDCAFSVSGLTVWNSLPESVRSAETLASFKRKLKPICSTFRSNLLLSFIYTVMPSHSGFVVGWTLNEPCIVLYCIHFEKIEIPTTKYDLIFPSPT